MKNIILILTVLFISNFLFQNGVNAQARQRPILTTAPKGTYLSNGMLKASRGYRFEISKDDNSKVLLRDNSGGISGEFTCTCNSGDAAGTCGTTPIGDGIKCRSNDCGDCTMIVVIKGISHQFFMTRKKS
jgi:hypothetical protein